MRAFLEQLYYLAHQIDSRFMSDTFLAALGFFFVSLLVLFAAQYNFNRPFHRGVIRGRTAYFIGGATGLAAVLTFFAWLFADLIFSVGLIDWYTAVLTILVFTPPFMLLTWHSNKIIISDEAITFHPSLYNSDITVMNFSDVTHVDIAKSSITIEAAAAYDEESVLSLECEILKAATPASIAQQFDKATYGQMKDLQEILVHKVSPSALKQEH
jgi:hypothetical protein